MVAVLLLLFITRLPAPLFAVPYSTMLTDNEGTLLAASIAADEQWRFEPLKKRRFPNGQSFEERYRKTPVHISAEPVKEPA